MEIQKLKYNLTEKMNVVNKPGCMHPCRLDEDQLLSAKMM